MNTKNNNTSITYEEDKLQSHFKGAKRVLCQDTKREFNLNDSKVFFITDWGSFIGGRPDALAYQTIEGGVLWRDSVGYSKIII